MLWKLRRRFWGCKNRLFRPFYFFLGRFLFPEDFLQRLRIRLSCNAVFRYDACDQVMVCHVKGGVEYLYPFGRHALPVPHFRDLLRRTLLDMDVCPGFGI